MNKKTKHKKQNASHLPRIIALFLLVIIISISATVVFYNINRIKSIVFIKEYELYVNVDSYIGFDVGTERLTFGTVPAGSIGSRKIEFTQNTTMPLTVKLKVEGDEMKNWVSTDEPEFLLNPGEIKSVNFEIRPEIGAEKKNYTGKLIAYFLK